MLKRIVTLFLIGSLCWFGVVPNAIALPFNPAIATLFSFSGTRPSNLGLTNDLFADCPSTPNCVSSFSTDPTHAIEPIRYSVAPDKAIANLKQTIESLPRTKIVQASDNYVYAEFTSKLMGFVDDVEFYLDKAANVIQVRSASRLGESDLGVNRQRIESIRAQLTSKLIKLK
ncbi:MAG: DUF1499 domain-containing protein [Phormidium tanganyikae FI6-MK23]|jgi:uncharacterized protein (DUF1499 family)|nr:DUF1499 domain-containing protein [Phormidium tanganyikae FI6-MK23]